MRNLCEQNIQKEIFVQAKTLKKKPLKLVRAKKNPFKLVQGKIYGILRKM